MTDALHTSPRASRQRPAWLTLAAVACLGVAGAVALSMSRADEPGMASRPDPCDARSAPRIGGPAAELVRYRLAYKAELCSGAECAELVDLSGKLEARARADARGADQLIDIRLVPTEVNGEVQPHLPSATALATPMTVTLSRSGRVEGIRYQQQIDAQTMRLLESVVRELQVSNPACADAHADRWSTTEELVTAGVMSHFEASATRKEIRWKRDRVLVWNDASELFPLSARSSEIASSEHSARLSDAGHVVARSGRDEFVLQSGAGDAEMRLRVGIEVGLSSSPVADTRPPAAPAAGPGFILAAAHSERADEARVGGHDLRSIAAELVRSKKVSKSSSASRTRLYVAASALFRRDATAAEQGLALVRGKHPESKFLLAALGDAGTARTADLLAELLKDTGSAALKSAVLAALGRASVANPSVVDALRAEFGDAQVGGTARLMTGALAHGTKEGSPETSEKAVQALVDDYGSQRDARLRADTLRALGNAGSLRALEVARRGAASSNPMERAAAAEALRRIPSDAADRLLATLMEDSVDFVRRSALGAALYRDPTELLVQVVERVARLDAVPTARREAIRVLVRWKDSVGSVRHTLKWLASNDPSEDLRRVAAEGLQRFSK